MRLRDIEAEATGLTRDEIVQAVRDAARRKRQGSKLERLIDMAAIGRVMGIGTRTARRHMTRLGIAHKRGRWWYVTSQDLKVRDPKVWLELELEASGR